MLSKEEKAREHLLHVEAKRINMKIKSGKLFLDPDDVTLNNNKVLE